MKLATFGVSASEYANVHVFARQDSTAAGPRPSAEVGSLKSSVPTAPMSVGELLIPADAAMVDEQPVTIDPST